MTDSSSLITTNSNNYSNPVTAASPNLASPLPNGSLSDTNLQDEEEYTIKCICVYADDDGNTVYCPKCDTWQHIDCYYHGKDVPEEHFCADCSPRELDAKRATERQRRLREGKADGGDRKVKRPASKGQKKKNKDTTGTTTAGEQVNGWHRHERRESVSNGRDQPPPAKKPKTSHRTSGSVVSLNGEPRKRASSNVQSYPSPSKSPQDLFRYPAIPAYTSEFLELYERDEGHADAHGNEHTIQALSKLSAWRSDPSLVVVSGNGQQPNAKSPFVQLDRSLDSSAWPDVSQEMVHKDIDYDGRHPTWRLLRIQNSVRKDDLVGEIRGEVGVLEEYCQQKSSSNRWQELQHPDPFVFFHPHMNIYIDSRIAGTQFRYLRRSCKPNVTLKTFVSADGECHHCFVASKDVQAGSELTAAWYIDPARLLNVDAHKEDPEQLQSRQFDWVSRVLANFGDCACDGPACLLAPFDRRYSSRGPDALNKEKSGRKKKLNRKHAVSPLSTGQATNSRAGSEALKGQDDDEQDDRRSTSESSRSGARSRDLTPVNVAALDANPLLGNNLTARELRKIQAVEKAFEQRAHGTGGQQKKKKRTSGGSTLSTPNVNASKQLGHIYVSNNNTPNSAQPPTSGGKPTEPFLASPSPTRPSASYKRSAEHVQTSDFPRSPAEPTRPTYRSVSIQTEPEECEMEIPSAKRRKFCTPTQRLLRRVFADRARYDQHCKAFSPGVSSDTSTSIHPLEPIQTDVKMKDVGAGTSPVSAKSVPLKSPSPSPGIHVSTSTEASPTFPLPSQAAHSHKTFKPNPAPKLQLSTLPPVPSFPIPQTVVTPSSTVNSSTISSISGLQSPLVSAGPQGLSTGGVTPSPAKKKLSLGDYMIRRNMASTPVIEKSQAQFEQALPSDPEGTKEPDQQVTASSVNQMQPVSEEHANVLKEAATRQGGLYGSAIDDTPMKDGIDEPEYSPSDAPVMQANLTAELTVSQNPTVALPPSTTATKPDMAPEVSQVLAQLAHFQDGGPAQSTNST